MCLAVPVRVVEVPEEGKARVQVGQGENYMEISTLLLPEAPRPGDYVIVHAGFALRSLDAAKRQTLHRRQNSEALKLAALVHPERLALRGVFEARAAFLPGGPPRSGG